ncbi:MAG TPA: hypothetical protein EYO73_10605 [Sulfurimonas sp.]|nr:hypothetical protein [Sulfurimonas sp.]
MAVFFKYFTIWILLVLVLFPSCTYADEFSEESSFLDELIIQESFLFRYLSEKNEYDNSTYIMALLEVKYSEENYEIDVGAMLYKDSNETGAELNQVSLHYFADDFEFSIGKYVQTLGALDYLSSTNLLNPTRSEFFDDENINIRRVPLLMAGLRYYPNEEWKLETIVQAFDADHQDLSSAYLNFALDTLMPSYLESLTTSNSSLDQINNEIFLPVYKNSISSALNSHIKDQYESESILAADKAGLFVVAEYSADAVSIGGVWINRYTEIPYIEVNQDLLDGLEALQSDPTDFGVFEDYINSNDLDPISKVQGYRYNQYNLYAEGTIFSFGIRAEASYRDKIPAINEYSTLHSFGLGIDHKLGSMYNSIEVQYLDVDALSQEIYASVWASKFDAIHYKGTDIYFDHYLLYGSYEGITEITSFPSVPLSYNNYDIIFQYLNSKEQSQMNTFSMLLKAFF